MIEETDTTKEAYPGVQFVTYEGKMYLQTTSIYYKYNQMSYLGYPRLHFSGRFQAAPSTVNNDPVHFDSDIFTPNDQLLENKESNLSNGWWNPEGHAYWRLRETSITSVVYKDGSTASIAAEDPIIGQSLADGDETVPGKIVDLDSEQQMVSEIWGWSIKIGSPSTTEELQNQIVNGLKASFLVAPFNDIWVRYPKGTPDSFFGAAYQSILQEVELLGNLESRFLDELKDEKGNFPTELSIKFNLDGFNMDDPAAADFTWGRITGSIGPYAHTEPKHFINARSLQSQATYGAQGNPVINTVPALIDNEKSTLTIDLGNSLPTSEKGGATLDMGNLEIGILESDKSKGETFHVIGTIPYSSGDFIAERAGIASFHLSQQLLALASSNPLAIKGYNVIADPGTSTSSILSSENSEGAYIRADQFVFRMEPDSQASVDIYATQFGKPAEKVEVTFAPNNGPMLGQQVQDEFYAGPTPGTPEEALTYPEAAKTDVTGKVTIQLKAGDPGNPRKYIDGQVYGVQCSWKNIDKTGNLLSVLIFSGYSTKSDATWVRDVQPILVQYANLYPVMKKILDLNSYHNVVARKRAMSLVFSQDVASPNYMPVTRDLSKAKRDMLLGWLDQQPNPKYIEIKTKEDLQQALQIAIELEHSTLPPYLTAYWSIIPGHNYEVSNIIRSVIMEEMLHMSLACNLLNAIGGKPKIDVPGFIPIYPTGLPGSLAPGLNVTLKKCSIDQIRDVFMGIENPDYVEVLHKKKPDANDLDHHQMTIGWFYDIIKEGFKNLEKELGHDGLFTGDASRQMTTWHGEGKMIEVTDLKSAKKAIKEIVEEGEGASPFDPEYQGDLAHYFKFSEIVEGREIVIHRKKDGFSYSGAVIPFDPKGVYPMKDNPGLLEYSKESAARMKSELFNKSYTNLLHKLHQVFNGDPEGLAQAIGIMFSLTVQARDLMKTPIEPGSTETAGPSFRYFPVNYYS